MGWFLMETSSWKKVSIGIFLALAFMPQDLFAARTVKVIPIRMNSVSGGVLDGVPCRQADVSTGEVLGTVQKDGPVTINHLYSVTLRNVSDVEQTVRIRLEGGSSLSAFYSGPGEGRTNLHGTPVVMNDHFDTTVTLAPSNQGAGALRTVQIEMGCSRATCWGSIYGASSTFVGSRENVGACDPTKQVACISMITLFNVRITVEEDRGAVLGSISGAAHRGCGLKDHYVETPPFIQINGGRPF